jgi:spectinomycin phosphotransferase/16S rRNA (guanine(1405)-N(7))-methyltransferase
MFTRPDDLADDAVADAVRDGWGVRADGIEYVPKGFGSFHWQIESGRRRWFVSVDDLRLKRRDRLTAALSTARSLRDGGLEFVVAPERTQASGVVHVVGEHFAVALYPYVDGETYAYGSFDTRADRLGVLDLIARLHAVRDTVALVDDFAIPRRDGLDDVDGTWDTGPFGEPARRLLTRHMSSVRRLLDRYDALAVAVNRPERFTLTHGEPHRANTITTPTGVVLIDWDTTLLGPPERDLWAFADEDGQTVDDYRARTGRVPRADALAFYRWRWDLTEISLYVAEFRAPHRDSADTAVAWEEFTKHLDPDRWRDVV